MKVAVMQPYFMPYLGYWQMLNAVDAFVVLDDVNYIKRGFINSNSILINGAANRFTIPLKKISQNKLINEIKLCYTKEEREKFLKTIQMSYKKASQYAKVYPILEKIIMYDTEDLTDYICHSIFEVEGYLALNTKILISSKIDKNISLRGESRIIEICKRLNADVYINAIGGRKLYNSKHFSDEGIELFFIQMGECTYQQYSKHFVPNLSLIDVLMFNDIDEVQKMLQIYELVR